MSRYHADGPMDPPRDPESSFQPSRRRHLPRYQLLLHADQTEDLLFVVRTIMELTRSCLAEAAHKTWEAHRSGQALLLVTYRERAELYVDQFSARGLTVALEPV